MFYRRFITIDTDIIVQEDTLCLSINKLLTAQALLNFVNTKKKIVKTF